ncbi:MAG: hypothetical protein KIS61_09305 [Candidatus Eremiobacteraeota bacterium]|nr:hypothetical protein [Candidatus Eremiobacteraeota bacterium]
MRQVVSNIMTQLAAAMPKLPEADLKPFDAELTKLRAPEQAEAKRLARIAELEKQKAQAIADQAEAQRISDIQAFLPEYHAALEKWTEMQEQVSFQLRELLETYERSLPVHKLVGKLASRLASLGEKTPYLRPTQHRADYWLRDFATSTNLLPVYQGVRAQLEAEGVAADD